MSRLRLAVLLLVALVSNGQSRPTLGETAARAQALSGPLAAPVRSAAVVALVLPFPAVLPCQEFQYLALSDRRSPIPQDVVEWWPAVGAASRFDTNDAALGESWQRVPIPAQFIAQGPVVLRFLRHPETAGTDLRFTLECRGSGSVSWECAAGVCTSIAVYPVPATRLRAAVSDRYGDKWSCGEVCKKPRQLEHLLIDSPDDLLHKRDVLVRFGHDVAADLADFFAKLCRRDRCSPQVAVAEKALRTFVAVPHPVIESATIVSVQGSLKSHFHTAIATGQQTLALDCEFFPNGGERGYRWNRAQIECQAALFVGREGGNRILSASLNKSVGEWREVELSPRASIRLRPEGLTWPAPTQLVISGEALRLAVRPPANPPPPRAPQLAPPVALPTAWPQVNPCRQFDQLQLEATAGVLGVEWRGPTGPSRFLLTEDPQSGKRPRDAYQRPRFAQLPVDARLLIGRLTAVVPILDPAIELGPKQLQIGLRLLCREPAGVSLGFGCSGGACETWLRREFAVDRPIGGSYLGQQGWTARSKDGRRPEKWRSLLRSNPAQLLGRRSEALLRLGRDMLTEMPQVIDTACQGNCAPSPLAAAMEARALLATPKWLLTSVKTFRNADRDDPDVATSGWIARMAAGVLALEVTCSREILRNEGRMTERTFQCGAALNKAGVELADYSAWARVEPTAQGTQQLDDFTQTVDVPAGAIEIHTGYSYGKPSEDPLDAVFRDPPVSWTPGAVEGSITISGAALLTGPVPN